MAAKKEKAGAIQLETPEGRVINSSFWEKDVYTDPRGREGVAQYKVEMAFDEDDIGELEDAIVDACVEEWGSKAEEDYESEAIRSPILDGNELADDREERGKSGEAYRDKFVVRASSIFNKHGEDAPGGIYVCDENAEEISFAERDKVYNGIMGVANVTVSCYKIDGRKGVTLYLNGFQVTGEGERLRDRDPSSLFKAKAPKKSGRGRKRRGS